MTDVPGKRVWGRWPQRVQDSVLRTTPCTRWAPRAQTRFTYVSFLTRVGIKCLGAPVCKAGFGGVPRVCGVWLGQVRMKWAIAANF